MLKIFHGTPSLLLPKAIPSKKATLSDSAGYFKILVMANDDTLEVSATGYQKTKIERSIFKESLQDSRGAFTIHLKSIFIDFKEVTVRAPEELPSKVLHRNLIANKHKNDKKKLDSYAYKLYTKIQFDLNNIGSEIEENKRIQKLNVLLNYLVLFNGYVLTYVYAQVLSCCIMFLYELKSVWEIRSSHVMPKPNRTYKE